MDIRHLHARDYIQPGGEFHCASYSVTGTSSGLHDHDFFEFFFLLSGRMCHVVNGAELRLEPGTLVLLRPQDAHRVEPMPGETIRLVNIAFPVETMAALADYLHRPEWTQPASSGTPSSVVLYGADRKRMSDTLDRLNLLPHGDAAARLTQLRRLLVLVTEFLDPDRSSPLPVVHLPDSDAPCPPAPPAVTVWLAPLLADASSREVFVEGIPALLRLSGKSHEHLCRIFTQYVGRSPTDHLNDQRINYAANLLAHSDHSVLSIALESGFSSLSYFNRVFRRRYGCAPSVLRREQQQGGIRILSEFL